MPKESSQSNDDFHISGDTRTKSDFIKDVYSKIGFSKRESTELVEMVFETLKNLIIQGNKVKISGFGNFIARKKRDRMGRNPQTGEPLLISARRVLTFRPSPILKARMNNEKVPLSHEEEKDDNF